MIFNSITFIFYFLPVFLLVYFLLPKNMTLKNLWVIIGSIFFYSMGEYSYSWLLIVSILINYAIGLFLGKKKKKWLLGIGVGLNLLILFYFKYLIFAISLIGNSNRLNISDIYLPLGISFFTFQGISYIVDVWRGDVKPEQNIIHIGTYIVMFPQLIAGPIVRYKSIRSQLFERSVTVTRTAHGIFLFMTGLAYKVILADFFRVPANAAFNHIDGTVGALQAWAGLLSYGFQIYFDFCGYSVMAVGLGLMLGFVLPINFKYPYIAHSVTNFWRRWHITLSEWLRDYVYIPLGGSRVSNGRLYFNLWVVFILCGLWHGAGLTFICWGIYHGFFLVIERWGKLADIIKPPRIISILLTFIIVNIGWVLFRSPSIGYAGSYFLSLIRLNHGSGDQHFLLTHWTGYGIFITIVAIILSTPFITRLFGIKSNMEVFTNPQVFSKIKHQWVLYAGATIFFVYTIMLILEGSYSSFIYFRF